MRLIDADALYEKTAEWEASALAQIEKLNRTPLEEMNEDELAEWLRWTAIWGERSAFKHDVADAPAAGPKWIPVSERPPEDLEEVNVTWINHNPEPYYNFIKDKPFTATAVYYKEKWYWYSSTCADLLAEYGRNPNEEIDDGIEIIAWMPLPDPWKGEK